MGQRITQTIYTCTQCGQIPEDGEYMWHMSQEIWCGKCINKDWAICDIEKNTKCANPSIKRTGVCRNCGGQGE